MNNPTPNFSWSKMHFIYIECHQEQSTPTSYSSGITAQTPKIATDSDAHKYGDLSRKTNILGSIQYIGSTPYFMQNFDVD
jgi:hypothetical protein